MHIDRHLAAYHLTHLYLISLPSSCRKMLLRSKPYLQHTQAVAKVELASLVILAKPKPALLHPENALGFDDHIEYAKWKTGQLAVQRNVDNYHKEVLVLKKQDTQKKFQAYTDFKAQVSVCELIKLSDNRMLGWSSC